MEKIISFGQGQMRVPIAQRSGMTRASDAARRRSVPESLFINRPDLAHTDPVAVTHLCETCGVVEPLWVQIGQSGRTGYLRRECKCEKREREMTQLDAFLGKRSEQEAQKAVASCYSWLGKGAEQKRLEEHTFETFDPGLQTNPSIADAYRQVLAYAAGLVQRQQYASNILFTGLNGVGKTHLACATINLARDSGVPCYFATAPHLFDALYATGFEHRPQFLLKVVSARVLVLDEMDKLYAKRVEAEEDAGSYQRGILGEIINGRYNKGLPTIITCNETGDVNKWLDRASRSRLGESMLTLHMDGRDMRRRQR